GEQDLSVVVGPPDAEVAAHRRNRQPVLAPGGSVDDEGDLAFGGVDEQTHERRRFVGLYREPVRSCPGRGSVVAASVGHPSIESVEHAVIDRTAGIPGNWWITRLLHGGQGYASS